MPDTMHRSNATGSKSFSRRSLFESRRSARRLQPPLEAFRMPAIAQGAKTVKFTLPLAG